MSQCLALGSGNGEYFMVGLTGRDGLVKLADERFREWPAGGSDVEYVVKTRQDVVKGRANVVTLFRHGRFPAEGLLGNGAGEPAVGGIDPLDGVGVHRCLAFEFVDRRAPDIVTERTELLGISVEGLVAVGHGAPVLERGEGLVCAHQVDDRGASAQ